MCDYNIDGQTDRQTDIILKSRHKYRFCTCNIKIGNARGLDIQIAVPSFWTAPTGVVEVV